MLSRSRALGASLDPAEVRRELQRALGAHYALERELGAGGMATVYLARDVKHDREVAVKVLRPELAAVLGTNRFLNEIKISARLDHPRILTLIDSGAAGGFLYYVMPFVRGESLRHRLKRDKQVAIDDALDITKQISSALDYAHRQGIVHRDIKPENILLHEGEAMLADFGIATAVKEAGGRRLTESGVSLGTPQYMSPEQATGDRELDARSDVYSMAAVLYEMLTGEPPHTGASVQAVIAKLLTERPVRVRVLRDTVPEAVDAAVAQALAKLPADRFASAGEFARALATPGALQRTSAPPRRWLPIAMGGAVAAVAAVVAYLVFAGKPAERLQPELNQVTITGRASAPSVSPDGARMAFAEQQCDVAGDCTSQLVISDIEGHNRLPIAGNFKGFWRIAWTPNSAYIVFVASYGSERWGVFAISALGGTPRVLGRTHPGGFDFGSGDTVFIVLRRADDVASGPRDDSISWVRRMTVHDARTLDSIRLRDPVGFFTDVVRLPYPGRLLLAAQQRPNDARELRLIDSSGAVIDRVTPGFGSLGRAYSIRWADSSQKLVVASQRSPGANEFDILSMDVTASRIGRDVDTVFSGLQMTSRVFDISQDGQRLIYTAGPVEGTLWKVDTHHKKEGRFAATLAMLPTTTMLQARISPAGDRILVVQEKPTNDGRASDVSIRPWDGGAESAVVRGVPNLLGFEWSPDGTKILYLHAIEANTVQLTESDTLGHVIRNIPFEQSDVVEFQPLPDGAICILPTARRSLSILRPGSKDTVTLRAPDWIATIWALSSLSPDAKSLAVLAVNPADDSILVATVDIETGVYKKIGSIGEDWLARIRWLEDGSITFDIYETHGAMALYTTTPGGPIRRVGAFPFTDAAVSVSNDGRHMVASSFRYKNDVYVIRNFGKMLRR
jgi:Tol biopolymer transport system component